MNTHWFAMTMFGLFFFFGMLNVSIHQHKNYSTHYSYKVKAQNNISFVISEVLKPTTYYDRYLIKIKQVNDTVSFGKALLKIHKDTLEIMCEVDNYFKANVALQPINRSKNPFQFDYKTYLERQQILYQITTKNTDLFRLKKQRTSMKGLAYNLRSKIKKALANYDFDDNSLAIINAMVLGQRQELSSQLKQQYANAGIMHVLAVSGLHVGIIMWILSMLFKPLSRFKNGVVIRLVLILIFLWMYAFIAGLSPSVIRAVTMFSAVAIALFSNRMTNVFFTLAISMFFLLLFNPYFLFSVGFQLSYLAVLFIVLLQPIFYKFWSPSNKVLDYFWQLTTVSLAAQIGVLPLSLYYFHQFPMLFLLANLIVLPFIGLILAFGIITIVLALLSVLPQFLAMIYNWILNKLNDFVAFIANQEGYLIRSIFLSLISVLLLYVLILSITYFIKKRTQFSLYTTLIFAIIFFGNLIREKYKLQTTNEFVVMHHSLETLLVNRVGATLHILHSKDSIQTSDSRIKGYLDNMRVKTYHINDLNTNILEIGNEKLLIIDSLSVYKTTYKPSIVLLRQSPNLNLERLIKQQAPKLIIADASNYRSYIDYWKTVCEKQKTPFYNINEKGAFVLDY